MEERSRFTGIGGEKLVYWCRRREVGLQMEEERSRFTDGGGEK